MVFVFLKLYVKLQKFCDMTKFFGAKMLKM